MVSERRATENSRRARQLGARERTIPGPARARARVEERQRGARRTVADVRRRRAACARDPGAPADARDGDVRAERAQLGRVGAERRQRLAHAAPAPRAHAPGAVRRGRATSALPRPSHAGSPRRSPGTGAAHARDRGADRLRLLVGPLAQERERHVQRLGRQEPQARAAPPRAPTRPSAATTPLGQLERDEQPHPSRSPSSRRRTRCSATVVERSRTSARPPGRCTRRVSDPSADHTLKHTVPTGLSSVPPPGPGDAGDPDADVGAEPLGRARARAPRRPRPTPRRRARSAPGRRRPAPSSPRRRRRRARRGRTPTSRRARSAARRAGRPCTTRRWRSSSRARAAAARPARRPTRRRRRRACRRGARARRRSNASYVVGRRRLVPRDDLDLAAPQAGRDLQRVEVDALARARRAASRRSRTPGCRTSAASPAGTPCARRSRRANASRLDRRRPHALQLARRARAGRRRSGPRARRPAGPRTPARCRPARAPPRPRAPSPACGCRARTASMSRFGQRLVSCSRIAAIRPSSASSSTNAPAAELGDDRGGEVVLGRPEAAAGDDEVHPLARRRTPSAPRRSSGRSPTTTVCAWSTPRSRRRSDSHGPLRSSTRPVSTSVPVTTMPARALTPAQVGPLLGRQVGAARCA